MKGRLTTVLYLLSRLTASEAIRTACPFQGPGYPSPVDISSNSSLGASSWANLTARLDEYTSGKANLSGLDVGAHTFSVGVFSTHDTEAQDRLQYHFTPVASGNTSGTSGDNGKAVMGVAHADGDSIYRVGSISKVMTVYMVLAYIGDGHWDAPVTNFIPELANAVNSSMAVGFDPIRDVRWDQVTLGALAGQMSGVARDTSNLVDELALKLKHENISASSLGLPNINLKDPAEAPICSNSLTNDVCSRKDYFTELLQRPPVYAPWGATPVYSDAAFELLAYALEGITGVPFDDMFANVFNRMLGMANTFAHPPPSDRLNDSVIPVGSSPSSSFFSVDIGNETAAAGMYSSLNDLNKLGVAMLNSTLLPADVTRRWLKPITHTSSLTQSVGRPWEIHRYTHQASAGRINDLYAKEGSLGAYASYTILSPDHDAGLTVLVTGPEPINMLNAIADIWSETVLVGWEAQAKTEAGKKLAGVFSNNKQPDCDNNNNSTATSTSTNTSIPISSLTLATPAENQGTGLQITNWTSQGVDFLAALPKLLDIDDTNAIDIRLYPTSLTSEAGNGGGGDGSSSTTTTRKLAFRAVYASGAPASPVAGFFSDELSCASWENVDDNLYGKQALDFFVLELGQDGAAVAVEVPALRARLVREE